MKKLILLLTCLTLVSCQSAMSPSDAMANAVTEGKGLPADYRIYYSNADEESPHYPSRDIKERLYSNSFDIDSLCEDYAILVGSGSLPYEIHLLRARSHGDLSALSECLSMRRDLLALRKNSSFNIDAHDRGVSALSYCEGRYAVLLVTEDNAAMRRLLSDYLS